MLLYPDSKQQGRSSEGELRQEDLISNFDITLTFLLGRDVSLPLLLLTYRVSYQGWCISVSRRAVG